jgi:hypothetical protein
MGIFIVLQLRESHPVLGSLALICNTPGTNSFILGTQKGLQSSQSSGKMATIFMSRVQSSVFSRVVFVSAAHRSRP